MAQMSITKREAVHGQGYQLSGDASQQSYFALLTGKLN